MNRIIIIILLLAAAVSAQSQINLNTPHDGNQTYDIAAPQYVKMLPGFEYKPAAQTTNYFRAYIDHNVYVENTYIPEDNLDERILNTNLPVGSTIGASDVSLTGAATYTIPFFCPPGTAGMQPSVSLVYNSQSGNGIAGYGWNLSGLSSISRVPQNQYFDNQSKGISFTNSDRLVMDGQRLVLANGSYGESGSEYLTEVFNGSKVTCNYEEGYTWFEVETSDKHRLEFGRTEDSRIYTIQNGNLVVISWNLNKIEDINRNFINFKYIKDGFYDTKTVNFRISEIEYTGNYDNSQLPYNKIQFIYSNQRHDLTQNYLLGIEFNSNILLKQVKIISEKEVVRKYEFSHFFDSYSYLARVTEIGQDGSFYNYTGFNYGSNATKLLNKGGNLTHSTDCASDDQFLYADYNGDGFSDILEIKWETPTNGTPWITEYRLHINDGTTNLGTYPSFTKVMTSDLSYLQTDEYLQQVVFADINGDGRADILESKVYKPIYAKWYSGYCLFSKPNSFNNNDRYEVFHNLSDFELSSIGIVEINGDGFADLLLNKYVEFNNIGWKPTFLVSKPPTSAGNFYSVTYNSGIELPNAFTDDNNEFKIGDFDGDGYSDIAAIKDNKINFYRYNGLSFEQFLAPINCNSKPHLFLGDFNGDRNTDLLFYSESPVEWHLKYSTGKELITGTCPISESNPDLFKFFTGDFNSDGVSDIASTRLNSNDHVDINLYSKVGGVFTEEIIGTSVGLHWPTEGNKYQFADFNADGTPEIVADFCYLIQHVGPTNQFNICYIYPNNYRKMLHKIADGYNNKQKFQYLPLTVPSVSSKITNPEYYISMTMGEIVPITLPLKVVSKSFNSNGLGGFFEKNYFYEQFLMHRRGKGVLGPKSFTITNVNTGMKVKSIYDVQLLPNKENFISYFLKENQSYNGTILLSNTINQYGYTFISYGYNNLKQRVYKVFPYESYSHNFVDNLHSKTVINSADVDSYGNICKTTTYYADDNGSYNNDWDQVTTQYVETNSWYTWKPKLITTLTKRANDTKEYQHEKQINYYPKSEGGGSRESNKYGMVNSIVEYVNTPKQITEIFTYDNWGNILSICVTSNDPLVEKNLTTTYEYDTKGRFKISVSNPLGHKQKSTINKLGYVLNSTDPNGLILSNKYDGFGNLIIATYSDNRTSTIVRKLLEPGEIEKVVYKIENKATGTPLIITYFDVLGRVIRKSVESFDGRLTSVDNHYNNKGELEKTSEPYFAGQPLPSNDKWTRYTYYADGRKDNIYYPEFYEHYTYNTSTRETVLERFDNNNTSSGIFKKSYLNYLGQTQKITDNLGDVNYTYYGNGLINTVEGSDHNIIKITYDDYNRQDLLQDPNAGTTDYDYDAYGQLRKQTDANNVVVETNFDRLGRTKETIISSGNTITYTYDGLDKPLGSLSKVTHTNGTEYEYFYNAQNRLSSETQKIDGAVYTTSYTYNSNCGEVETTTYPSGFKVRNDYNENGYLMNVYKNNDPTPLINLPPTSSTYNQRGQLTSYVLGNGLQVNNYFDNYGKSTGVNYGDAMQLAWQTDPIQGNLMWRKDLTNPALPLEENFEYTDISKSRLNSYRVNSLTENTVDYNNNGNIKTKSDAGTYIYDDPKHVYAVTGITAPVILPKDKYQDITYTDFGYVSQIKHSDENETVRLNITYGPDYSRIKTNLYINEVLQKTKYFIGGMYEIEVFPDGSERKLHYIPGPAGLVGIFEIKSNGEENMYYVHTDQLGSWKCITNSDGNVVEKLDYDPWGRRRNATDWSYNNVPSTFLFDRGYTGHEMLNAFVLINMNGRVYDPVVARFLSPDNYVQAPDNTQGLNRYSYCLNNPLKYTDPSGEFFIIPAISYSSGGGLDISITVGLGLPGGASVQATVGYNFGSNNAYITLSGSIGFVTGYVGYGTQSGFYYGVSLGLPFPNNGLSTNLTSIGVSWSQRGGLSYNALGCQISSDGYITMDPSVGISPRFNFEKQSTPGSLESPAQVDEQFALALSGSRGYGMKYSGGGDPPESKFYNKDGTLKPVLIEGPNIVAKGQYIVINGKKVYWGLIGTGTTNYHSSHIVTVSKVKMNDAETKEYFKKIKGIHSSVSNSTGWISWGTGASSYFTKAIGFGGFTYMQLMAQLHTDISNEFDAALTKYNTSNEIKHGLWLVTTRSTTISAGLVSHFTSYEFYTPNGQLFYTITY